MQLFNPTPTYTNRKQSTAIPESFISFVENEIFPSDSRLQMPSPLTKNIAFEALSVANLPQEQQQRY